MSTILFAKPTLDDEWASFLRTHVRNATSAEDDAEVESLALAPTPVSEFHDVPPPEPSDIYISTKTKLAYFTKPIDLDVFWDIPVIPYATPTEGVVKKQIKIHSKTREALDAMQTRLLQYEAFVDEQIITHIDNPCGRIKFRDIRKITVGLSKKNLMAHRITKRQAFYNCFVIIMRLNIEGVFKEFHIKVFNTGQVEIPGIQREATFQTLLQSLRGILLPMHGGNLDYCDNTDTVLINSNFHCRFHINREKLVERLEKEHGIQCLYDPCSYPGAKCKFYYDPSLGAAQTGRQPNDAVGDIGARGHVREPGCVFPVSCMIFRTGNVLIVGMCEEEALRHIYSVLTRILKQEFPHICQQMAPPVEVRPRPTKLRRRMVMVRNEMMSSE